MVIILSTRNIPLKLFNELKIVSTLIEQPEIGFNELCRLACLPRSSCATALNRLIKKNIIEKKVKKGYKTIYKFNNYAIEEFIKSIFFHVFYPKKRKTKLEREVEKQSRDIPEGFGSYEDFKKWWLSSPDDWKLEALGLSKRFIELLKCPEKRKFLLSDAEWKRLMRKFEKSVYRKGIDELMKKESKQKWGIDREQLRDMRSHARRITREFCSECNQEVNAVIDYERAEIVCMKCGTVIEKIQ